MSDEGNPVVELAIDLFTLLRADAENNIANKEWKKNDVIEQLAQLPQPRNRIVRWLKRKPRNRLIFLSREHEASIAEWVRQRDNFTLILDNLEFGILEKAIAWLEQHAYDRADWYRRQSTYSLVEVRQLNSSLKVQWLAQQKEKPKRGDDSYEELIFPDDEIDELKRKKKST